MTARILIALASLAFLTGSMTEIDPAIANAGGLVALAYVVWRQGIRNEDHLIAIRVKLGAGDPRDRKVKP